MLGYRAWLYINCSTLRRMCSYSDFTLLTKLRKNRRYVNILHLHLASPPAATALSPFDPEWYNCTLGFVIYTPEGRSEAGVQGNEISKADRFLFLSIYFFITFARFIFMCP